MNRVFKARERVKHRNLGCGAFLRMSSRPGEAVVDFDQAGVQVVSVDFLRPWGFSWSEVKPGDTAEFKVQGDTLSIKAQGEEAQPTVLGWKTTELDGVWELLSIKKRNPPVPVHLGAKVEYRDRQWVLLYAVMVPGLSDTKHTMIWIEISPEQFNWVGHMDIDRERFEVIFAGWKIT